MVLFLGFAAALTGVLLVAFNSGQVSNAKMRAMNAADAAAYSGAVWEARSLNYQAYMNRAMIVNEVTIAQSVSLRSWVAYLKEFVERINNITQFVPWVGKVTTAIKKGIVQIDNSVQNLLPIAEKALRTLNHVEHNSQNAMNGLTLLAAQELASEVAQKNGASMSTANTALWVPNGQKWLALTETYSSKTAGVKGDGRARLREVALNSRDGFTQARNWSLGGKPIAEARKQGGTELMDYDSWKGVDSAQLRSVYFFGWKVRLDLGWGGAQSYSSKAPVSKMVNFGGSKEWGDSDGKEANKVSQDKQYASKNGEFPGYRDIQNTATQDASLSLPFAVEVVIKDGDIPDSVSALKAKSALTDGTTIDHDPNYGGSDAGVFALSEACVTFERPFKGERRTSSNGIDNTKEYPSLFNPYWRASLATESAVSRSIVDAAKKLIPVAIKGGATCKSGA